MRDGALVKAAEEGSVVEVVLEQTPFYAESGGQDSDAGLITGDGVSLEVLDVQRPVKGLIVHRVQVTAGELVTGADVLAAVDGEWRLGACQAHSGTHVMHAALRQVLGPTALQSGSYNKPGYLRLDFAWPSGLSQPMRSDVEEAANRAIRSDLDVSATYMPLATAREIGALALFGETYDEEVRVVEMGGPWSRELCGGTHVQHTSQIGLVTLTGESSVGAGRPPGRGLRRHRGLPLPGQGAGPGAGADRPAQGAAGPADRPGEHSWSTSSRRPRSRSPTCRAGRRWPTSAPSSPARQDLSGVGYIAHQADGVTGNDLRSLALEVRNRVADTPAVVAVVGGTADKPSVVVVTTEGARDRGLKAGDLVRTASETLGGRGGGKDDIAQGGGTDGSRARRRPQVGRGRHRRRARRLVTEDGFRRGVRLAVDWGDVRIGVAACDADGVLAYPLSTVAGRRGRGRRPGRAGGRASADRGARRSAAVAGRPGGPGGGAPPGSGRAGWPRPSAYRSGWWTNGSPR